jgi:hypothetical protein
MMESDLDRKLERTLVVIVLSTTTLIMSVGFLVLG